jgi:hypothetical protein
MYEVLVRVAEAFKGERFGLFLALVLAGSVLIAVNAVSHALIEILKGRSQRRALVTRALRPALGASERLISRMADIFVTHQERMAGIIREYDALASRDRLPTLTPISMNRHESTAFRLAHLLSLIQYFLRETVDTPTFPLLERANYYLEHKIRVGLRGYVYNIALMSTKVQEEIGEQFFQYAGEKNPFDLSADRFLSFLTSRRDGPDLFTALMTTLHVDTTPLVKGQDLVRAEKNWCRMLALAHLSVYLIDFFQEFENNCRWEEERVLFVRLIVQWNADSTRHRYLYEPGDLSTGNYIDTYPGRLTPPSPLMSICIDGLERLRIRQAIERFVKWTKVNLRGGRYRRRHDSKRIHGWGVSIKTAQGPRDLRSSNDLLSVYQALKAYESTRVVADGPGDT